MADWFPGKREGVLTMASAWVGYITPARASAWGISTIAVETLGATALNAQQKFEAAEGPQSNQILRTACNTAFDELEDKMRDMKKRFFIKPPLVDADFPSLMLPLPDKIPTPHPTPEAEPGIEVIPLGRGGQRVTALNLQTNTKKKPALVTGVAFASRVRDAGSPPCLAEDMPSLSQTRAVKDFHYSHAEFGKVVDYAVAYEASGGKRGPWSQVVSLTIV